MLEEHSFEFSNFAGLYFIQVPPYACLDDTCLQFWAHRLLLFLFQQLSQLTTSVQLLLGRCIQIWAELSERCHLSLLCQFEFEWTWHLLHGFDLSCRTNSGHWQTHVDGRSDTPVKQLSLKEDLTVSDWDHVGWDESRHITCLGFDDRKCSKTAASLVVIHLGCTFEQTGVQVEHVSRVCLASRRSTEEQRHLSIGHGLFT